MEVRSFNSLWVRYQESIEAYKSYNFLNGHSTGVFHKKRVKQLYNAVKYYEKKMLKFGEGSVIKAKGTRNRYDKVHKTFKEEPFEFTFTGISVEDAKEYINTLVKLDILKVNLSTIDYYIIKTGIHLLTKPVMDYE